MGAVMTGVLPLLAEVIGAAVTPLLLAVEPTGAEKNTMTEPITEAAPAITEPMVTTTTVPRTGSLVAARAEDASTVARKGK